MTSPDRNPATPLLPGEPAPWFRAPALHGNANYAFDTVAGRYVLLLFFGAARRAQSQAALKAVMAHRHLFDDEHACFFGVTIDPTDAVEQRIAQSLPGIRHFLDYDRAVSRAYGAVVPGVDGQEDAYHPHWLLLDPMLRVVERFAINDDARALSAVARVREDDTSGWAPVLLLSRIFEPELCRRLVDLYESHGGEESGFMREVGGKTTAVVDPSHKRRRDVTIEDRALRDVLAMRVRQRLIPPLSRAFQFTATRMERYIVACYDSHDGGHFRPHRDNTTKGTAHRRFAVTINLNAEDYEGGDLRFPEFGTRAYRAPTGGAIIFSCSLLHEAMPVTRGRRYAFLPFLYDEDAARERGANNLHLGEDVAPYSMFSAEQPQDLER